MSSLQTTHALATITYILHKRVTADCEYTPPFFVRPAPMSVGQRYKPLKHSCISTVVSEALSRTKEKQHTYRIQWFEAAFATTAPQTLCGNSNQRQQCADIAQ
jgi:hypothetical protein